MVERELQDDITILPLSNTMTIYNLINSVEEDEVAQVQLNDSEIIQMIQEAEEEKDEQEEEQVEMVETSKEEELTSRIVTASILDVNFG